jgi:hypothetical protein
MAMHHLPVHRIATRVLLGGLALSMLFTLAAMGAAHAAVPGTQSWVVQTVVDPEARAYDQFGSVVALSGDTAFIAGAEFPVGDGQGVRLQPGRRWQLEPQADADG